ncbi:Uncharacterised protein [Mycobacterium tuberculosis]|nr:Uncharacterised protein [Mycobacterium tuberculosis]
MVDVVCDKPAYARLRAAGARITWIAARNRVADFAARITGLRIGGGKCSNASQLVRTRAPSRSG